MKNIVVIILLSFTLFTCKDNSNPGDQLENLTPQQQVENLNKLKLKFANPVLIMNSVYVLYPLVFGSDDKSEGSFSKSSYEKSNTTWNILFYNTANGEYHLLHDTKKMDIHSYDQENVDVAAAESSSSDFVNTPESRNRITYNQIYYSITTDDFNKDGKIDAKDPRYLFISDREGRHFRQISPDNLNVRSWEPILKSNTILMIVMKDTNGDKKFDEEDESFQMVYNLTTDSVSTEIFPFDYKLNLMKLLEKQWIHKN